MSNEDKMRAEFERWVKEDCEDEIYADIDTWKACAESYEKKLAEKDAYIEGQNDSFALMMERRAELQKQLSEANTRNELLVELLTRYRNETPLGNQPHMIAEAVDSLLAANKGKELDAIASAPTHKNKRIGLK